MPTKTSTIRGSFGALWDWRRCRTRTSTMSKEIERKFLVQGEDWREAKGTMYRQGYLSTVKERSVRVRVAGDKGYLTIKGISKGATRTEYEYEIPIKDAEAMLDHLCERPLIEKRRHKIDYDGVTWE